jgi:hypothetical protein
MPLSQTSAPAYFTIWRDSSQPPYQSIVWTLTGVQSLALLAFLGAFITFTQPSWWIIIRYLLVRILRPVRLPDADEASSLHNLSQTEAIRVLILGDRGRSNQHMTYISPLFGLASLVTAVLFLILGVIFPYFLTSGSGPATVQSQGAQECDGLYTYTPTTIQLAKAFYTLCQTVNIDGCTYPAKIVPSRNKFSISMHDECPFSEFSCVKFISPQSKDFCPNTKLDALCSRPNRAIRIESLDALPSEYGLNADGNMRISHRVTCAPIRVKKVQVDKMEMGRNATVFWVGYPPWQINETETWPTVGETRKYFTNDSISNSTNLGPVTVTTTTNRGPFKLKSGMVYDAIVNRAFDNPHAVYENFHPGLNRHDGDMFIVMYQYSVDLFTTPVYAVWPQELLRLLRDDLHKTISLTTTAIACVEQYRLCFHTACTEWDNAANTTENMKWFLQQEHQNNSLETLRPQVMLMKASSLRYFLQRHHGSTMFLRSILRPNISQVAWLAPQQWHFEVRTWFDLAFLTTKFSVLKSSEGDKRFSPPDSFYYFPNTSWICDKVLLIDENYTNVNFIGFMATLGGLTFIFLLSRVDRLILSTKNGFSRWRKAWQTTWKQSQERLQVLRRHFIAVKAFIQSIFKGFWLPLTLRRVPSFWRTRLRNIDNGDFTDDYERISIDFVNV